MTGTRLNRWLLTVACLLLLSVLASGTAHAADPYGRLSENILSNQVSGAYNIEIQAETSVDDSAFAVDITDVDGAPLPEGANVSLLLAPVTDDAGQSDFTSGAAATEFTPEQERAAIAAAPQSPGTWTLNPAPLDEAGPWKGRLLVDGPAGAESAGFYFDVHPPTPAWPLWLTASQPLIPLLVLGLALLVVRAIRQPLLQSPPVAAESSSVPAAAPRTPTRG